MTAFYIDVTHNVALLVADSMCIDSTQPYAGMCSKGDKISIIAHLNCAILYAGMVSWRDIIVYNLQATRLKTFDELLHNIDYEIQNWWYEHVATFGTTPDGNIKLVGWNHIENKFVMISFLADSSTLIPTAQIFDETAVLMPENPHALTLLKMLIKTNIDTHVLFQEVFALISSDMCEVKGYTSVGGNIQSCLMQPSNLTPNVKFIIETYPSYL